MKFRPEKLIRCLFFMSEKNKKINFSSVYYVILFTWMFQETYDLNTTDLANGKVDYFNSTFQADYQLSFIDKVHIAITCTQRGWFDNSLGK